MSSWSSRKIIKIKKKDGWFEIGSEGDHFHFEHLTKKGKVTVPHPVKDIPIKTVKSIFKQAKISDY